MKKVWIRHLKNSIEMKDAPAFIMLDSKPKIITFQYPVLRNAVIYKITEFLNDNVTDAIKHEFAHLKYSTEGKKHSKWMKQIKLFKDA